MSHTSQRRSALLGVLTLSAVIVACMASASPVHRAQYEVYNDQQTAPRDEQPASDQETVANEQAPAELQSHGAEHQTSQPQANESAPPPAPGQSNAFVSEKSNEPQDIAQTERQDSSEPPQSQSAAPSAETKSGEDDDPYNP